MKLNSYFIVDKILNFETLRKTIVRRNCLVPGAQDLHSTTGNYPSSRTSSQSLEFRQVLILFINNIINRNYLFYLAKHSRSKNMACLLFFRIGRLNIEAAVVSPPTFAESAIVGNVFFLGDIQQRTTLGLCLFSYLFLFYQF